MLTRRGLVQAGATIAAASVVGSSRYAGPNVLMIRFGGGVRRRETIDPSHTYAPYFLNELVPQGTLFRNVSIADLNDVTATSHAQGTLYLLTGRYDRYTDIGQRFLSERFEPAVPTLPEYLRKAYDVPDHECLIVNGEDRKNEEYLTFSNDHEYGISFRSNTLSLARFKRYLIERQLDEGVFKGEAVKNKRNELEQLRTLDYRNAEPDGQGAVLDEFWRDWRVHYGDSGLKNPRGDRLLTALALRAMSSLSPKFMLVNYQDPDYVHWGNPAHYTRALSIIDDGIRQLVNAVDQLPAYRGNTAVVVVPDCGRDDNRFQRVPFQHHFNSRSAHEIFAYFRAPQIAKGRSYDDPVDQIDVTKTVGALMGIRTDHAEGRILV